MTCYTCYFLSMQAELSRILYPTFLHTYLYLVSRGESQLSGPFLDRWVRTVTETEPTGGGGGVGGGVG
jgi:hypothetical protein